MNYDVFTGRTPQILQLNEIYDYLHPDFIAVMENLPKLYGQINRPGDKIRTVMSAGDIKEKYQSIFTQAPEGLGYSIILTMKESAIIKATIALAKLMYRNFFSTALMGGMNPNGGSLYSALKRGGFKLVIDTPISFIDLCPGDTAFGFVVFSKTEVRR